MGFLAERFMKKNMTKILRFRLPDEIVEILSELPRKSDFVRAAIREKLEREKLLTIKMPF